MSGYRQRRDPREIALELLQEAHAREARALADKHHAEVGLVHAQASREAASQKLGAHANLVRHLEALGKVPERPVPEATRADVARLEAERAAFLRERGVAPGPALTEPGTVDVSAELAAARAGVEGAAEALRAADAEIAAARSALAQALEALGQASRARVAVEAELAKLELDFSPS